MNRPWWWLALGVAACAAMVVPAHVFATAAPSPSQIFISSASSPRLGHRLITWGSIWWGLYVVAVVALLRAPRRAAVVTGVLCSAVVGAVSIARRTTTSSDLYRYVWDGRVQASGIDPYRYAPTAPQLDRLHFPWLWPDRQTCVSHLHPPDCTLLDHQNAHTIYPPLAQLWFLFEHFVIPLSTRDRGYEVVGLLLVVAVSLLLVAMLASTERNIAQVVIWGACPAVAIEAVENAHVDALAALVIVLALWAAEKGNWALAAVAVGAAGLIKLYPLVLFPAIVQGRRLRGALIVTAMFVIAYLPHVLVVGRGASGFLGTYLHVEGYGSGNRYELLNLLGLHGPVAVGFAVGLIAIVVALAFAKRLGSPANAALVVFAVVLFVATPGEPWEDISLVVCAAVAGAWSWTSVVLAEEVAYLAYIFRILPGGDRRDGYGIALIAAALLAFVMRADRRFTPTIRQRHHVM